jgi:hypothetical protein
MGPRKYSLKYRIFLIRCLCEDWKRAAAKGFESKTSFARPAQEFPSRRASRSRGSSRVAAGIIASGAPPMPLNPSTPCHMWLVPTPDLLTLSTSQHSCTGVIRSCSPMMQRVSAFTPARRSITSNRRTAWARRLWVAARILVKNPVDAYIHASAICKCCSKGSGVRLGLRT